MSFDTGMKLFRAGDIAGAIEEFREAVDQDENNHKVWNALGICFSKSGEYEDADTCFENALMLDPGNATYEKNRDKNDQKRPVNWQVRPKQEVESQPKSAPSISEDSSTAIWKGVKILGGILIGFVVIIIIISLIFGPSSQTDRERSMPVQTIKPQIAVTQTQSITKTDINDAIFINHASEFFNLMSDSSKDIARVASIEDYSGLKYYSDDTLAKLRAIKEDIDELPVSSKIQPIYPGLLSLIDKAETAYTLMSQGAEKAISGDFDSANSKLEKAIKQINELKTMIDEYNKEVKGQ